MSNIVKTTKNKLNLNSRKGRQEALKLKLQQIDEQLKNLGVDNIKYKISGPIVNLDTPQNTIAIANIVDISMIIRFIAYFQNIQNTRKTLELELKIELPLAKNTQGYLIQDIISDLKLRLLIIINQNKINELNEIKTKLLPFVDEETRLVETLKSIKF